MAHIYWIGFYVASIVLFVVLNLISREYNIIIREVLFVLVSLYAGFIWPILLICTVLAILAGYYLEKNRRKYYPSAELS